MKSLNANTGSTCCRYISFHQSGALQQCGYTKMCCLELMEAYSPATSGWHQLGRGWYAHWGAVVGWTDAQLGLCAMWEMARRNCNIAGLLASFLWQPHGLQSIHSAFLMATPHHLFSPTLVSTPSSENIQTQSLGARRSQKVFLFSFPFYVSALTSLKLCRYWGFWWRRKRELLWNAQTRGNSSQVSKMTCRTNIFKSHLFYARTKKVKFKAQPFLSQPKRLVENSKKIKTRDCALAI